MKVEISEGNELYPVTTLMVEREQGWEYADRSDVYEVPKAVVDGWKKARDDWRLTQQEMERWVREHPRSEP